MKLAIANWLVDSWGGCGAVRFFLSQCFLTIEPLNIIEATHITTSDYWNENHGKINIYAKNGQESLSMLFG